MTNAKPLSFIGEIMCSSTANLGITIAPRYCQICEKMIDTNNENYIHIANFPNRFQHLECWERTFWRSWADKLVAWWRLKQIREQSNK